MMKELTVDEWQDEISKGLEFRRQFGLEKEWRTLELLFYHTHKSQANSGPNLLMSTGDAMLSSLSVPYPYITIKPRRMDAIAPARVLESVDNMLICEMNFPRQVEYSLTHAYLYGVGIMKLGYDSEFGYDRNQDINGPKQPAGMTLSQFDKTHDRIEFGSAKPGMPWVSAVMPHDIVVPWGVRELDESPWIAHRVVRHLEDIKADVRYKSRTLQATMTMKDFVKSYESERRLYRIGSNDVSSFSEVSNDAEYVEMWEIHDRRTGKVYVIATHHDKFLRNEEDVLQINGELPFVDICFTPRTRSFWVTPDAYYLKQCQAELSDITIQGSKNRRAGVMKLLLRKGLLTAEQIENLTSSDVGAVVEVETEGSLNEVAMALTPTANPQLVQIEAEMTRRNARETIGMSSNQLGEYNSSSRRSATEAQIVSEASNLRMNRRQGKMKDLYVAAFRKINQIVFQFWTTPRLTQVLDQNGIAQWTAYTGQDLEADYAYNVGFTISSGETLQGRRQAAVQSYLMLMRDPNADQAKLRQYLASAYNDPEFSAIWSAGVLDGSNPQAGIGPGNADLLQGAGGGSGASGSNQNLLSGPGQGSNLSLAG